MNSSAFSGALPQHFDVLNARPDTEGEKISLIEELKQRGNAAFKRGAMDEAEILFGKAIEHDGNKTATLLGNRAAARIAMKKYDLALEDAEAAVKADEKWAKGWFRKGQALSGLGDFQQAKLAFEKTIELDPNNKDGLKQVEEMMNKVKEQQTSSNNNTKSATTQPSSTTTTIKTPTPTTTTATTNKSDGSDEDDDPTGESMRGYKTLADGRKTTFFHREIPLEEKQRLAAANVPKPINGNGTGSNTTTAPQLISNSNSNNKKDGSVWNAAGTFEERDFTQWAKDKLTELINGTNTMCDLKGVQDTVLVEATGISNVEGAASISYIRGQKRFPFDFTLDVDWSCDLVDGTTIKGKLFISEFSSESDDISTELRWEGRDKAGQHANTLVSHIKKEFNDAIVEKLKEFVVLFKSL
jgi:tetratricopeptide (TPR) repeat protein